MIHARVARLLQLLHEEGFSWLAAEIATAIEQAQVGEPEIDFNVDGDREAADDERSFKIEPPMIEAKGHAGSPEVAISPEFQTELAADMLVRRLQWGLRFLIESNANLEEIAGAKVPMQFLSDDLSVSDFHVEDAKRAVSELSELRDSLIAFLFTEE